jgi:ABC-type Na+ efflux pump permease subunit
MVWLPVVERELRVAARKRATYRIRVLALLPVTVALAWAIFTSSRQGGMSWTADGRALFVDLALPAGIFSILIGGIATSDCMGVEKREGTLGLLFLTDLKGYDVVFGKLVASSLNGFYALIAVLPVLGVPILVGGVTFLQFLELTAALVTAIVFSLSAGIFVSTFEQNERKAMFLTCAFLGSITFAPILVGDVTGTLWLLSPAYAMAIAVNAIGPLRPAYWCSLALTWLMTFFMLNRASIRAPKTWQEKVMRPAKLPVIQYANRRMNRKLLDANPFAWLAARGEADPRLVWVFLASMLGIWLLFLCATPGGLRWSDMFTDEVIRGSDLVINTVLKIWIISEASRRFAEDRRNGAFELLLSTPLDVRQIIEGQWLALRKQFAIPILAVLAWDVVLGIGKQGLRSGTESYEHWVAMFFLLADAMPLSLAGMWLGLSTQSRNRAILTGILLVLTMPWLASFAVNAALNLSGHYAEAIESGIWGFADLSVFVWAASSIDGHFRRIATEGGAGERLKTAD